MGYPAVKAGSPYAYSFWHNTGVWRTDRIAVANTALSIALRAAKSLHTCIFDQHLATRYIGLPVDAWLPCHSRTVTFRTVVVRFQKHSQSDDTGSSVLKFWIGDSNSALLSPRASGVKHSNDVSRTAEVARVSSEFCSLCFCTSASMATSVVSLFDDDNFTLPALWFECFELTVVL